MKLNEARVDLYIAIAQAEVILQSNLSVAVKQGVVVVVALFRLGLKSCS